MKSANGGVLLDQTILRIYDQTNNLKVNAKQHTSCAVKVQRDERLLFDSD